MTHDLVAFQKQFALQEPSLFAALEHFHAGIKRMSGTPRAYIVGGFVRDALLGNISNDVDLEVYGVAAERLAPLLEELFPGRVHAVGKAFGIIRVALDDTHVLDVALPRRESKKGTGHRGFEIEGDPDMSIEDASRRRDFTVNAMLIDLETWTVVDPFDGLIDLTARRLRIVDPTTFSDDPLRVYRAIQLAARLDFDVDDASKKIMRAMVEGGELATLSKERVTDEMRKLMMRSEHPSRGFTLARELGLIERDYPELQVLIGTEQEPEWHPEGDVWIHTLMVIDQAAHLIRSTQSFSDTEKLHIMIGALCHDLGKPSTTEIIDGRIRSRGHEEAGIEPAKKLLAHWTFGDDVERAVLAAAAEHLKPGMLFREREQKKLTASQYRNAVRRVIRRIAPVSWRILLAISESDWRGRGLSETVGATYEHATLFRTVALELEAAQELRPLIEGRDLLALGLTPGPRIGELIKAIEEARDRDEIKTREEALAWVRPHIQRRLP